MRHFTFRPPLTLSGRKFRGLRGLSGKPFHPPLTDVPITAYLFAAAFDILSLALRNSYAGAARELYAAGTWLVLGGATVSLLAALTGWADWHRSSEPGTQARRTVNAHAIIMLSATALTLIELALRALALHDRPHTPLIVALFSVAVAVLISIGATYGGSLVYDYGFNVETAGDHPVWHKSETDVLPGQQHATPSVDQEATHG
jgi:uncharacterized membrane protein